MTEILRCPTCGTECVLSAPGEVCGCPEYHWICTTCTAALGEL